MTPAQINALAEEVLLRHTSGDQDGALAAARALMEVGFGVARGVSLPPESWRFDDQRDGVFIESTDVDVILHVVGEDRPVTDTSESVEIGVAGYEDDDTVWVSAGTLNSALEAIRREAQARAAYWGAIGTHIDRVLL